MKRNRPVIQITLSPESHARLNEAAKRSGQSRSSMIEKLIREMDMPRPPVGSKTPKDGGA